MGRRRPRAGEVPPEARDARYPGARKSRQVGANCANCGRGRTRRGAHEGRGVLLSAAPRPGSRGSTRVGGQPTLAALQAGAPRCGVGFVPSAVPSASDRAITRARGRGGRHLVRVTAVADSGVPREVRAALEEIERARPLRPPHRRCRRADVAAAHRGCPREPAAESAAAWPPGSSGTSRRLRRTIPGVTSCCGSS